MLRKTYVSFGVQGLIFMERYNQEVQNRDLKNLKIHDDVLNFFFYDVIEVDTDVSGKMVKTFSDPINKSGIYYVGELYTLYQFTKETKEKRHSLSPQAMFNREALIAEMKKGALIHIVKSGMSGFVIPDKGDYSFNPTTKEIHCF